MIVLKIQFKDDTSGSRLTTTKDKTDWFIDSINEWMDDDT